MKKSLKLILQISTLLLVVALIGAGIYWLVQQNYGTVLVDSRIEGGQHAGGGFEGMRPGSHPDGMALGERNGRTGVNFSSGIAEVFRILLEIGVITLLVLLVQWLIQRLRKPKTPAPVTVIPSATVDPGTIIPAGNRAADSRQSQIVAEPQEEPRQDLFPPLEEEPDKE